MYLWKIESLKEVLREERVTKEHSVYYLLLFTLLYFTLSVQSLIQIDVLWNKEMMVVQILISFLGITYAYHKMKIAKLLCKILLPLGGYFCCVHSFS